MTIDEQIEIYIPLVKTIIGNNYPALINDEDAFQEGIIGIWNALQSYDEKYGYPLKKWVTIQIKGAVSKYFRRFKSLYLTEDGYMRETYFGSYSDDFDDDDKRSFMLDPLDIPLDVRIIEKEEREKQNNRMRNYLNKITERERAILIGVINGQTFREIGKSVGLSAQRVYQIYQKLGRNYIHFEMRNNYV